MGSHSKYQKIMSFKGAISTPSSESTAALAKKMFNTNQLFKGLTLLKFEPASSSAWQLQPGYWEERGFTFLSTGANVEERVSEIFAATVLSLRTMPVAESTWSWPMKKPQKRCLCQSEVICRKTKSILHSVLPICMTKRDKGRHRFVREQTTWN